MIAMASTQQPAEQQHDQMSRQKMLSGSSSQALNSQTFLLNHRAYCFFRSGL